MEMNESPVYLILDPSPTPGQKDLPVSLYETGMKPFLAHTMWTRIDVGLMALQLRDAHRIEK